MVCAIYS